MRLCLVSLSRFMETYSTNLTEWFFAPEWRGSGSETDRDKNQEALLAMA